MGYELVGEEKSRRSSGEFVAIGVWHHPFFKKAILNSSKGNLPQNHALTNPGFVVSLWPNGCCLSNTKMGSWSFTLHDVDHPNSGVISTPQSVTLIFSTAFAFYLLLCERYSLRPQFSSKHFVFSAATHYNDANVLLIFDQISKVLYHNCLAVSSM